jgi:hypothetical protein
MNVVERKNELCGYQPLVKHVGEARDASLLPVPMFTCGNRVGGGGGGWGVGVHGETRNDFVTTMSTTMSTPSHDTVQPGDIVGFSLFTTPPFCILFGQCCEGVGVAILRV